MTQKKIISETNKKLKEQFRNSYVLSYNGRYDYTVFPNLKNHIFKIKIKTKQELSISCLHSIELIEYNVKIRRKKSSIPTSYDDIKTSVLNTKKSWKNNSKRKNQWFK